MNVVGPKEIFDEIPLLNNDGPYLDPDTFRRELKTGTFPSSVRKFLNWSPGSSKLSVQYCNCHKNR